MARPVGDPNGRHSRLWRENRSRALYRDKRRCRECRKVTAHPHVHHVIPWAPIEGTHDLENLMTLCDGCHRRAHTVGLKCLKRRRVVFEYVEATYERA